MSFELGIVKYFNNNFRFLDPATKFISHIPFLVVFWSVLTIILTNFLGKNAGVELLMAYCVSLALHFLVVKKITDRCFARRNRPFEVAPKEIIPIGQLQGASSFPSGHTVAITAIATVYSSMLPEIFPFMAAIVMVIAFSRIHNGMHYPSDVLGGMIIGFLYGNAGLYAANYLVKFLNL